MRYQLHNHLGSAALELDDAAQLISYEEYHPYGTTAFQAKNAGIKAAAKRYRYTGMERDEESGLEYHSARYYLPWLGRWASCDPIGIEGGINIFQYSNANPICLMDSAGTQSDPAISMQLAFTRAYFILRQSAPERARPSMDRHFFQLVNPQAMRSGLQLEERSTIYTQGFQYLSRIIERNRRAEQLDATSQREANPINLPASNATNRYNSTSPREGREQSFAVANPRVAYFARFEVTPDTARFQTGLPQNNPTELARSNIPSNSYNLTNGSLENAFRHTYGQARLTSEYGRQAATDIGNAHEDLPNLPTTSRYFVDNENPSNALDEADTVADLLNNEIGRQIAERMPNADKGQLALETLRVFHEQGLYVANFNAPGVVQLRRQTLTDAQYQSAVRHVQSIIDVERQTQEMRALRRVQVLER